MNILEVTWLIAGGLLGGGAGFLLSVIACSFRKYCTSRDSHPDLFTTVTGSLIGTLITHTLQLYPLRYLWDR